MKLKLHMHKNALWLIFIALVGVIAIGYSLTALYRVYQYSQLTQEAETTHVKWTIKKSWGGKFYLQAHYVFLVEGTTYEGQTEFTDEYYINSWAAEQKINQFKGVKWKVGYSPKKFSHSTLQKKFPTKECYSAAILVGLFVYFIFLGLYAGTFPKNG
jgi:hypothetical protein